MISQRTIISLLVVMLFSVGYIQTATGQNITIAQNGTAEAVIVVAADATEAELKKRTLTNLYNQRPTWLDLAHDKLDQAVFAAYGWPPDLTDDQILERLLALNLERSEQENS